MFMRLGWLAPVVFVSGIITASTSHADVAYGVFMVVKGDIKVKGKADAVAAKVGSKIAPGETVISGAEGRAKIVMSDRNVINISPSTTLQISKYENDSKSGAKNVELTLLEGKVRNNVEQTYDGEKSKFQIKTPTAVAGVRGTQFMTSFNRQTQMTSVVTLKGTVSFAAVNASGQVVGKPVLVNKGESTSAASGQAPEAPKKLPKEELKKVDAESTASHKEKAPESSASASTSKESGSSKESKSDSSASSGGSTSKSSDAASSSSSGGSSREPASTSSSGSGSGSGGMVDKKDMDVGLAKEIKAPASVAAPAPLPTVAPPVVTAPAAQNPLVRDVIRDNLSKTKVIVRPTPQQSQ